MNVTGRKVFVIVGMLAVVVLLALFGNEERDRSADPAATVESVFDRSEILATGTVGGWVNVDFLVSEAAVEEARACVRERTEAAAVACYAFANRRDYQAAQASAPGNFRETCYEARWSRNKEGTEGGGLNRFKTTGCPGKTVVRRKESIESGAPPDSLRVEITAVHKLTASGLLILGLTNLPDGTVLSTSVSDGVAYMAQAETSVRDGAFQAGPFSVRGRPLAPGRYEIGVTVPTFKSQPQSVRRRLGDRLEFMTGPLARWMAPESFGKVASVRTTIRIQ